jgi:hypothetical protein
MKDQIKELITKGIKLDYREIYEGNAVILRWGNDVDYIESKITIPKLFEIEITQDQIQEIRNITEDLIKACIEEYCKNE